MKQAKSIIDPKSIDPKSLLPARVEKSALWNPLRLQPSQIGKSAHLITRGKGCAAEIVASAGISNANVPIYMTDDKLL